MPRFALDFVRALAAVVPASAQLRVKARPRDADITEVGTWPFVGGVSDPTMCSTPCGIAEVCTRGRRGGMASPEPHPHGPGQPADAQGQAGPVVVGEHPRYVLHDPPVHCSWMNQVEQWFSIARRKRLRIADFASREQLAERLIAFISECNEIAHPFNSTSKSVAKVMAKCQIEDVNPVATAA
jgi:hypothetical protein